ncbi:thioredoxin, putative [Eimeria necatrix]|uniref:Thioredoxin, putative n=1 Tax=Eimeria necatrix TaxID=51315 RepID=U6MKM0_9EIME|nr:thioredoxin, putative [Eimeria necatrix]CDJ64802.1 thioredoxin, putative [Eimeria necatrix]
MAKGETGQLAASSLQSKAAKAAPAHAAARRRSSTVRRWTSVVTSKWAWSAVVIVAVYLGFFYRPRLLRYTFEIAGGPGLNPEFPSPSRHFRIVVRNAKGHQEVPAGFKANNIRLSWQTVPHIPGQSGPPVGYEVYDIGNGEYEVAYRDLENFATIDLAKLRAAIPKLVEKSSATSFLHYVIKDNQIFRKAHGPFPAFSYFSDMVLHQLSATVKLPDVEFVMNVGDWPLVAKSWGDSRVPVFSWCGSTDSFDIVLPQWDVTRSTVLGNAASSPDLLASQGWGTRKWNKRDPRAAFRGRDSNPVRVQLAQLSSKHPDLLDVAITSWENDENFEVEEQLGRKGSLQLQEFSKYKYILLLDGTVAAYRNPYLIASGSLLLKQESPYYEWYQKELSPWKHFVPFDGTGEDLLSKLQWAKEHDEEAQRIAANARDYARRHLLPERVLCFYYRALHAYASRQKGTPAVTEDMIWVPIPHRPKRNTCGSPDVLTRLGSYPIVPLHPTSVESVLFKEDKDAVVIAHSAFCNKSARVLPGILAMARQYKAAGADLLFASAETFSLQYPIKWLHAGNGPKLFFLKAGSATPEQLNGRLTVSAAVSFINSKLSNAQHRITAPPEPEEAVSDPIPEKWDGPVKRIVAKNFDERVLNSDKDVFLMVSAPWCGYCKKIKPAFFRFARSVAASSAAAAVLDVAKMNGPTNEIRHPEFPVPHYPTIWFIRKGETKPIIFSGSATEEKLLSFAKQHATKPESLEGVVVQAPDLRTSSLPLMKDTQQQTGSPILSIDTETFYSGVLDSDKDVLLLVYAPWCGHCKKLEPIYEEFGKLAAESKTASESLVVAKMDGAANRLPDEKYKVTGFPTVWFFKKGSDTPIKFMGERTTKGLASFVQQHATAKVELKVPDSPAVEAVSQPVPTVNDGAVKVVVGDTFKSQVLDAGKVGNH